MEAEKSQNVFNRSRIFGYSRTDRVLESMAVEFNHKATKDTKGNSTRMPIQLFLCVANDLAPQISCVSRAYELAREFPLAPSDATPVRSYRPPLFRAPVH